MLTTLPIVVLAYYMPREIGEPLVFRVGVPPLSLLPRESYRCTVVVRFLLLLALSSGEVCVFVASIAPSMSFAPMLRYVL